jgi:hypothetical protein
MIDALHLDQYLVTSSGKFTCLGRTTHYDDRVIGEDMPTTLEGAAQMAFAECVDCTSIRVLRLNYAESGFTDVTEQVTEYVAYNLINHQNEDVSPPEWAEIALQDFRELHLIQTGS